MLCQSTDHNYVIVLLLLQHNATCRHEWYRITIWRGTIDHTSNVKMFRICFLTRFYTIKTKKITCTTLCNILIMLTPLKYNISTTYNNAAHIYLLNILLACGLKIQNTEVNAIVALYTHKAIQTLGVY